MTDLLVRRAGLATALMLAILLAFVAYRPVVRSLTMPQELRLVPSDAALVAYVPSIDDLAAKLHSHTCNMDYTNAAACPFVTDEGEADPGSKFTAYRMLALTRVHGVDTSQPAMLAVRGPLTAGDMVLVLSAGGAPDACARLQAYLEGESFYFTFAKRKLCDVTDDDGANGEAILNNGLTVYVKALRSEAGEGRVLLGFHTNPAVFSTVLARRSGGDHLLSQDGFAEAYHTMTQGRQPAAWAFARQPGLAPFAPSALSLTFEDADAEFVSEDARKLGRDALAESIAYELDYLIGQQGITQEVADTIKADMLSKADFVTGARAARASLWLAPSVLYSRNLSGLLAAEASPSMSTINGGSSVGLSLTARQLMEFVRFADHAFPGGLPAFLFRGREGALGAQATIFETLLSEVMRLESVDGLDARLVDLQDRIPNIVLRISISETEAQRVIDRVQASEQKRRDVALVNAVLKRKVGSPVAPDDARAAMGSGGISTRGVPGAFAHLLAEEPDPAAFEAAVSADPLNTGCWPDVGVAVADCSSAGRFFYLQPPLNEDDIRLRTSSADDAAAIRKSLLEDQRFRAVALYEPGARMLWVASDRNVLAGQFGKASETTPAGHAWLKLSVQPDSLYTQMKAQGFDENASDSAVRTIAESARWMSVYDKILLTAESLGEKRGTRIDLELTR